MSRSTISLQGEWEFQTDPERVLDPLALSRGSAGACPPLERTLPVPGAWQAEGGDLESYVGRALYRRAVDISGLDLGKGRQLWLHCGAVDYHCRAYVNGHSVGEHVGGYTHFAFDVTHAVGEGGLMVVLDVEDEEQTALSRPRQLPGPRSAPGAPGDDQSLRPHGKQEWYISVSGPWQPVWLESVPTLRLDAVRVTPDLARMEARVTATLSAAPGDNLELVARVYHENDPAAAPVATWQGALRDCLTGGDVALALALPDARLWTPDTPHLYRLELELRQGDHTLDAPHAVFGMRSFEAHDGKLYLNGEPFYLVAALDQDLYPEGIYTPPSREYIEQGFRRAKELGLNCLRCHIKLPDPAYLEAADRLGLLVWAEVPSWRTFYLRNTIQPHASALPEATLREVKDTLTTAVLAAYNHPSVVIWTLVNEDWGTDVVHSAEDRSWLADLYDYCKRLDPTRLVVDNSACLAAWGPNFHVKSDLDDFHLYYAMPDHYDNYVQAIKHFGLRPLWSYTPYGDGQRRGDEPLVLSEFGNWGLPTLADLRRGHGITAPAEPPWFHLGNWWSLSSDEGGWPFEVEQRFTAYGLDRIFASYDDFARATQWHQFNAFKAQIEAMRVHPAIVGYVITEFTDAYWEANGLLDFCRNPKAYHADFATFNNEDVIIPNWQTLPLGRRDAYWSGETCHMPLLFSHYSKHDASGLRVAWSVAADDGNELFGGWHRVADVARGQVGPLIEVSFPIPDVETAREMRIEAIVHNAAGQQLACNYWTFMAYPAAARWATPNSTFYLLTPAGVATSGERRLTPANPLSGIGGDMPPADRALQGGLAARLHNLGYGFWDRLSADTPLAVATSLEPDLLAWVRDGGTLLFIANSLSGRPSPFLWVQGRTVQYSGDWITNFSWIAPQVCRRTMPQNPLGFAFKDVMAKNIILGFDPMYQRPENADGAAWHDVLAGSVEGWIRAPAGYLAHVPYGAGQVVMTTFDLTGTVNVEPVGTALFHDLVDYCLALRTHNGEEGHR